MTFGGGVKGQMSLSFNNKVISNGIFILLPASCPRSGAWDAWGQTFYRGDLRWRPINCAFYFLFVCSFVFFHVSVNFFSLVLVQQFFSHIESDSPGVWIYNKTQSK